MATINEMEMLAGKAIFEGYFRRQLFEDPYAAAKSVGVQLDPDQVEYIRSRDLKAFESVSNDVQFALPFPERMAWGGPTGLRDVEQFKR